MSHLIQAIHLRAQLFGEIRNFFKERQILEVETPLLWFSTITDPNIHSFVTSYQINAAKSVNLYLQTSPEFAMKRLLAAGSGSIFQICKAFRNAECGRQHNPEFTILEWYRAGFNHHDLMDEMDDFLRVILNTKKAERLTYSQAFQKYLNLNPFNNSASDFKNYAAQKNLNYTSDLDHDGWLNLLMSYFIEPHLGKGRPTFIYDYPASQAALAKLNAKDLKVAERFEVYIDGVELANGFHELNNSKEQRQRFVNDLKKRQHNNLAQYPLDEEFLQALDSMPDCAGVAVGLDRILMLLARTNSIKDVLHFPIP